MWKYRETFDQINVKFGKYTIIYNKLNNKQVLNVSSAGIIFQILYIILLSVIFHFFKISYHQDLILFANILFILGFFINSDDIQNIRNL